MPERPAGKRTDTDSGVDPVGLRPTGPEHDAAAERAPRTPADPRRRPLAGDVADDDLEQGAVVPTAPDDALADDSGEGIDPDVLDRRERRQTATRKPVGPTTGSRIQGDDVVIDTADLDDLDAPPPTEPG